MDLLGDLGTADQLTSARAENAVLQARVKELQARVKELTTHVKVLTVEKASLEAEVEIYRKEAALPNFTNLALGQATASMDCDGDDDSMPSTAFFKSGDGVFCKCPAIVLKNLHGGCNPACAALSHDDDAVLATGGADSVLKLVQWGAENNGVVPAANTCTVQLPAPVICTEFSPTLPNTVAAGAMDGSLQVACFDTSSSSSSCNGQLTAHPSEIIKRHSKYIKDLAWCSTEPILATSSADGDIHVYRVETTAATSGNDATIIMSNDDGDDNDNDCCSSKKPVLTYLQSLHLEHPVEAMCFVGRTLLCHARGTAHLTMFDENYELSKINLNTNRQGAVAGGFDEHVSFCVLDLKVSPCGKYLACATDASRHIIIDVANNYLQIRNLYGHTADGFSSPVIAWSRNCQYLYSNNQNDTDVVVYEIASGKIVDTLKSHSRPVKDMYSSSTTNTLVTTSFDKQTVIWFAES